MKYSESALEDALIHGWSNPSRTRKDFAFIARQKRLPSGVRWYRVIHVFHRRLRCRVIIDLKSGKFTHPMLAKELVSKLCP